MKRLLYNNIAFFLLYMVLGCTNVEAESEPLSYVKEIAEFAELPNLKAHQSMAIYGNYAIFITHYYGLIGELYDINKKEHLASLSLPYSIPDMPHANTCCFGKTFWSKNSFLPLLYASSFNEEGDKGCYVYDLEYQKGHYIANLVMKVIPEDCGDIIGKGALDWVVDSDQGHLYSIAYKDASAEKRFSWDNKMVLTKWRHPSPNTTGEVSLTQDDIIETSILPPMPFSQDKFYYKNSVYIISGGANEGDSLMNRIRVINLSTMTIEHDYDIAQFGVREPEGFSNYGDRLLVTFNDGHPEKVWEYKIDNN